MIEPAVLSTNYSNASSSMANSFGTAGALLPVLAVLIAVLAALIIGSNVSRIEWFHKKMIAFSQTLYYTVVGIASTVVIAVFVAPVYLLSQADGETKQWVLYAIGGLIVAYVVFTILGYIVDRLIVTNLREYIKERNENENV